MRLMIVVSLNSWLKSDKEEEEEDMAAAGTVPNPALWVTAFLGRKDIPEAGNPDPSILNPKSESSASAWHMLLTAFNPEPSTLDLQLQTKSLTAPGPAYPVPHTLNPTEFGTDLICNCTPYTLIPEPKKTKIEIET